MASTSITFEQQFDENTAHISSITVEGNSLVTIDEVMQDLVKPVLLAAGFHNDLIKQYIDEV